MLVEIFPTTVVEERSGISEKSGKPWRMRSQTDAFAHIPGEPYPVRVELGLATGQDGKGDQVPWPAGRYDVDLEASIFVNFRGQIEFRREMVLLPSKTVKAA